MGRLTSRDKYGCADIITISDIMPDIYAELSSNEMTALTDALNRLAAYEDTGMTPEEITAIKHALMGREIAKITEFDGIAIERLQELAKAEKDGRLAVVPCKAGDALWSYYNYPANGAYKITATAVSTLDGITVINTDKCGVIPEKDIGKTVFLTREEAEAALKREVGNNEID